MTRSRRSSYRGGRRTGRSAGRLGFTLIEVLVVVSVIALLISILLPSLRAARDEAKRVACLANLHDLGSALHQYATVYDPYLPLTPYIGSDIEASAGEDDNLFVLWHSKFVKTPQSFTCPATKWELRRPDRVEKVRTQWGTRYDVYTAGQLCNDFAHLAQYEKYKGYGTSYEYSAWYKAEGKTTRVTWFHAREPFDSVDRLPKTLKPGRKTPAYLVLMHDADESGPVLGAAGEARNNLPEPWDNHGTAGMNILFADGHVTFVKSANLDQVKDQQVLR